MSAANFFYAEHVGRIELLDCPVFASTVRDVATPPSPSRTVHGETENEEGSES